MVGQQGLRRRATDELFDTPVALVLSARASVATLILLAVLLYQGMQKDFINPSLLYPVYLVLAVSSLLNLILTIQPFSDRWRKGMLRAIVYGEVILISFLIYFSGVHYSVFVFLYLLNLVGSGLMLGRDEAMNVVLWTTLSFNFVYILGSEASRQSFFFVIIFNNLAFFGVAWLSGYLHDQLLSMGGLLRARGQEISQLKNLNRIIVSSIPSGLVLVDDNGITRYLNKPFIKMFKAASPDVGRPILEVLPKLGQRLTSKAVSPESSLHRLEYKINDTPGDTNERALEILISPIRSREAGFSGHLLIIQDLTEVKKLEFSLRQSEKLAAIGQLAAGIAHEIRNPLASISGSIQLLKGSLRSEDQDEQRLMGIVIKEIDRLNSLIGEFLDYSRPDQRISEKLDLSDLVLEILRLVTLNDRLPQGVEQQVSVMPNCYMIGDAAKLKQAIMNIVINAYQAMEDVPSKLLRVSLHQTNTNLNLSISDSGCGIAEQELTRIFDPFHTTKHNGTGLGLAISHKILKNHRGMVEVRSRIGEGTTFNMVFPIFDETSNLAV